MNRFHRFFRLAGTTFIEGFGLILGLSLFCAALTWLLNIFIKLPFTPSSAWPAAAIGLYIFFLGVYYGYEDGQRDAFKELERSQKGNS